MVVKVTVVLAAFDVPIGASAGPLVCAHRNDNPPCSGMPSSVAVPASKAGPGSMTVWSAPAEATGARFAAKTVTFTFADGAVPPEPAVTRRPYSPAAAKRTSVLDALGLEKTAFPGPLTVVQAKAGAVVISNAN